MNASQTAPDGRRGDGSAALATLVHYMLDGVEHVARVPPGTDRWDAVAEAVGGRLRCQVRAEEPPTYDSGTRGWTLNLTVFRPRRRAEVVPVPVHWR